MKKLIKRVKRVTKLRGLIVKKNKSDLVIKKVKTEIKLKKLAGNYLKPDISVYFDSIPANKKTDEWMDKQDL